MDRTIWNSQSQLRSFDLVEGDHDTLYSLAYLAQDILGQTTTYLTGLTATPTGPASLTLNLAAGRIYQVAAADATSDGAIPQDLTNIYQQGVAAAQNITLSTSGISTGQSRWSLVQAQFNQADSIRSGDPTGGLLFFYNSSNPSDPFEGPGNDGLTSNTVRKGIVTLQVVNGSPATTGSEVPPNPTSGWVPLYLIDLSFGQTAITSGQILTAGPSVGTNVPSNYPQAPFLAGLTNQHHKGIAGQAPQIDLTAEVKNVLPLSQIPASSSNSGTGVPVLKLFAGNPNSNVAGNANVNGSSDLCYDTTHQIMYICTTTGSTSTAVWTSITQGTSATYNGGTMTGGTGSPNAYVIASTSPGGFSLTVGVSINAIINVTNTGAATLNVDSLGAVAIVKATGSGVTALTGGEMVGGNSGTFNYLGASGFELVAQGLGSAAFKTASGSGTFVSSISSSVSTGNLPKFADTNGTIQDSGITPGTAAGKTASASGSSVVSSVSGGITSGHYAVFADGNGTVSDGGSLNSILPAGLMMPYAGSSAPSGWLLCYGQSLSTTTYATLFAAIGYTFGGSGANFNAPDMRGNVPAGVDNMGGTAANRITSACGITGTNLGAAGGNQLMQSHTHGVNDPAHIHAYNNIIGQGGGGSAGGFAGGEPAENINLQYATTGITIQSTGSGASQNVQPTIMLNYIIKT